MRLQRDSNKDKDPWARTKARTTTTTTTTTTATTATVVKPSYIGLYKVSILTGRMRQ